MTSARAHYRTVIMDNARWDGWTFRDGDILISTPPKCGTTWTQMICALLIFQTTEFPQALDVLSPWFDQRTRNRDEMAAALDAQPHRRFIKSHTPLDGLPWDDRVTYVAVSRDPRDVAISMDNHLHNMDWDVVTRLIESSGAGDGDDPPPPPPASGSPRERFWQWMESTQPVRGLTFTLHHLATFWEVRHRPNVVLLRYGDLQADLEGQMRSLADRLGIDVAEDRWPELVEAATFASMKERATALAPNATQSIWRDTGRFFNRGTSGQWRELLDDTDLERYAALVRDRVTPELSDWIHHGPILAAAASQDAALGQPT